MNRIFLNRFSKNLQTLAKNGFSASGETKVIIIFIISPSFTSIWNIFFTDIHAKDMLGLSIRKNTIIDIFIKNSTKLFSWDMVSLSGTRKTVSLVGRMFSYLLKVKRCSFDVTKNDKGDWNMIIIIVWGVVFILTAILLS